MGSAKTITALVSRLFKDTSIIKHIVFHLIVPYNQESVPASLWPTATVLTLCRSGKAVLLGGGLTLGWLQWHLCDRGFLGYVVLHWLLYSGLLGKGKHRRISPEPLLRGGMNAAVQTYTPVAHGKLFTRWICVI